MSLRRSSDAPRRRLTRSLPIHYAKSLRFIFCSFSSMKPDSARFRTRFSWESRVVTVECVRNEGKAEGGRERGNHAIFFQSRNYISVALLCEHPARKVNNNGCGDIGIDPPFSFSRFGETRGERQGSCVAAANYEIVSVAPHYAIMLPWRQIIF